MQVRLPMTGFSPFKVLAGSLFLSLAIAFPAIAGYSFLIALIVGKAHGFGAWMAMWRAGKLSWQYISWMIVLILGISYWGMQVVSSTTMLACVTYFFFAFHFFFDEFDLQEEERSFVNVLGAIAPLLLVFFLLVQEFFLISIPFDILGAFALLFLALELLYTKEIGWFFVHTKVLLAFVLASAYTGASASAVLSTFLIFHYFFWFIYPVYKLHKYRREERDGFIMILVLLVASSVYFAVTRDTYGTSVYDLSVRVFLIGTIVHVLATAPFGYYFGLPRPSVKHRST